MTNARVAPAPNEDSYTNAPSDPRPPYAPGNGVLSAALALARVVEAEADRALAIAGLSARGFLALREIRSGPAVTQRDLARRLHLKPSTTCELLVRLARRGLLARRGSRAARPGSGLPTLTPAGIAALVHAESRVARLEREWARRMRTARSRAEGPVAPSRGTLGDGWVGPIYGLHRWLTEGLAALTGTSASP
jgi:DNA-binding MarR family transcriptional regulator